jgi:hypothetical protein
MSSDMKKFIFLYFQSLLILIIMGIILPYLVENLLIYITRDSSIYQNSILVSKSINKQLEIVYNYVYIFRALLRY